ncbi:hypothetical protein AeMF1_001127 [Aphanomyces euteiches]|nr:hypothetical protein AeMF1_001127 [Aphanomyces euteiches]KAH9189913.1 hypothetical protein AeNC1_008110 [Aphanomyces euteiches]
MATAVNESVPAFLDKYTRRQGRGGKSFFQLKQTRTTDGFDCVFLDRKQVKGKAICRLYNARPMQCRTWPFWPENLESRQSWESLKTAKDGCPGINKGPPSSVEHISQQRDDMMNWRLRLAKPTKLK